MTSLAGRVARIPRSAVLSAYLASATNLVAGLAILVLLRPGLPSDGTDLVGRLDYIHSHLTAWWGGWLTWHLAALTLLAFYIALARRWEKRAPIRSVLVLVCAGAGLAADLSAESLYMGALPDVDPAGTAVVDSISGILTGYLGNGLYTLAGLLLVTMGIGELPRPLVALSAPVWIAGFALSAASLAHAPTGQFWATAVLMPSFVLWTALVGRWLDRQSS